MGFRDSTYEHTGENFNAVALRGNELCLNKEERVTSAHGLTYVLHGFTAIELFPESAASLLGYMNAITHLLSFFFNDGCNAMLF